MVGCSSKERLEQVRRIQHKWTYSLCVRGGDYQLPTIDQEMLDIDKDRILDVALLANALVKSLKLHHSSPPMAFHRAHKSPFIFRTEYF